MRNAIDALALKPGGDEPLKAELLCDLGEAQAKTGDLAEARKTCLIAIELARRVNRPEPFARAVVTAGRGVSNSGETDHELVGLLSEALDRLGPSIHHRRFFAPVVAAREKHQPWTIKREPDLFTVDASLEVAVSVPN